MVTMQSVAARTAMAAAVALLFSRSPLAAPVAGMPLEKEFRPYDRSHDPRVRPAVASCTDGRFAVVWQQLQASDHDTSRGIYLRTYDAAGHPLRDRPIRLSTSRDAYAFSPGIAADGNCRYDVVWFESPGDAKGTTEQPSEVFVRQVNAGGRPLGPPQKVGSSPMTLNGDGMDAVAADPAGEFIVAWNVYGERTLPLGSGQAACDVKVRRYRPDGVPDGDEQRVNEQPSLGSVEPDIDIGPDGDAVVVWQQRTTGAEHDIEGRLLSRISGPVGSEFRVETTRGGGTGRPKVAISPQGAFIVTWATSIMRTPGEFDGDIFLQQFDASAHRIGVEAQVNTNPDHGHTQPDVAVDRDGDALITWVSYVDGPGFATRIDARRYSATGSFTTEPFPITEVDTRSQPELPRVAADGDGDLVAVWDRTTAIFKFPDGDTDVFVRRFASEKAVDVSVAAVVAPGPLAPGAPLSVAIRVTNESTTRGVLASGLHLRERLPRNFALTSFTGSRWSCTSVDHAVSCDLAGALQPGLSAPLTLELTAATRTGTYVLGTHLSGRQFDPDEASAGSNNEALPMVRIVPIP